jgi:molecular chaperone GrpE
VAVVLAEFQAWLTALPAPLDEPSPDNRAGPDLFTLLEQFTALRHEVNLQTRSARSQQEQNAATLAELTKALDALQRARADAAGQRDDHLRPLLKTLIELHDALSVANREAQRVQDKVLPLLSEATASTEAEPPEIPTAVVPALARWLGVRGPDLSAVAAWRKRENDRAAQRRSGFEHVRKLLSSLTTGYTMSLQRVERSLKQHGLEPLPAAGLAFDPERMEAVEAVLDSGLPPGQVIDEVQRGYLWNGRLFRYAKVRVAKGSG